MANAYAYPTTPLVGGTYARRTTSPEFELGHIVHGDANKIWIYVQATAAVAAGATTLTEPAFTIAGATGNHTATAAFAINEYGWVHKTAGPAS